MKTGICETGFAYSEHCYYFPGQRPRFCEQFRSHAAKPSEILLYAKPPMRSLFPFAAVVFGGAEQ